MILKAIQKDPSKRYGQMSQLLAGLESIKKKLETDIGKKLNVNTVPEGSVRKTGNRLRITAKLINVADGYHLWLERYDREMKDVFAIQDEITAIIVSKLKTELAMTLVPEGKPHSRRFKSV